MVFEIKIKWAGQLHKYDLEDETTMSQLKEIIQEKTNIRHDRQKIIGLKAGDTEAVKQHYKVRSDFCIFLKNNSKKNFKKDWAP